MNQESKNRTGKALLLIASAIVGVIALGHLAIIYGGPAMYRASGAGNRMADLAESGSWIPALATLLVTLILATWAVYAYAGATGKPRLPALRTVLMVVAGFFILRGLAGSALLAAPAHRPLSSVLFIVITSSGSLVIGLLYLFGTRLRWKALAVCGRGESA